MTLEQLLRTPRLRVGFGAALMCPVFRRE